MSARAAVAVFLAGIAGGAAAQERCLSTDTPRQCVRRLIAMRAYVVAEAQTEAANTGTPAVTGPVRSAVKDFLSAASAHLDHATIKDSGTAFTLDYNLPGTLLGARRQVNLQAVVTDPALSAPVQTELAGDAAKLAAAKQSLGRGDDILVALSFNPVTQRLGRGVEQFRPLLDSMLAGFATSGTPAGAVPAEQFDVPFAQQIADPVARLKAMTDFEAAAIAAMPAALQKIETDFGVLTGNQPQLFVTAGMHRRAPLVGAREREYRLTWEIGSDNVNDFRRNEGRGCEERDTCLTALSDYMARRQRRHRSGRFSFQVGYRATAQNDPGLAAPAFEELKAHTFTYAVTYGQEFTTLLTRKPARFDITFAYDGKVKTHTVTPLASVVGLPLRPNAVGLQQLRPQRTSSVAATVTPSIFENLYAPMSIVFQNKTGDLPGTSPPLPISPGGPGGGHTAPFSMSESRFFVVVGLDYRFPSLSRPSSPPSGKDCCCCKGEGAR